MKKLIPIFLLIAFTMTIASPAKALLSNSTFTVSLSSMIIDGPDLAEDFMFEMQEMEMAFIEDVDEESLDAGDLRLYTVFDRRLDTSNLVYEPVVSQEQLQLTLGEYKAFRIAEIRNATSNISVQHDEIGVLGDEVKAYSLELAQQLELMLVSRIENQYTELVNLRADIADFSSYTITKATRVTDEAPVVSDSKAVELIIDNTDYYKDMTIDIDDSQTDILRKLAASDDSDSLTDDRNAEIIKVIEDDQVTLGDKLDDLAEQRVDIEERTIELDYIKSELDDSTNEIPVEEISITSRGEVDSTTDEESDDSTNEILEGEISISSRGEIDSMTDEELKDLEAQKEAELSIAVVAYNDAQTEVQEDLRDSITSLTTFTIRN